jgi:phage shock protein C
MMKKLYRSETDKMFAGVCGGIAEYFDIDAAVVRLGFAVFSLLGGSGIMAYLAAAIIIPKRGDVTMHQDQ